jgi:hypothetical protein
MAVSLVQVVMGSSRRHFAPGLIDDRIAIAMWCRRTGDSGASVEEVVVLMMSP